jgi:hypothetical protein
MFVGKTRTPNGATAPVSSDYSQEDPPKKNVFQPVNLFSQQKPHKPNG